MEQERLSSRSLDKYPLTLSREKKKEIKRRDLDRDLIGMLDFEAMLS